MPKLKDAPGNVKPIGTGPYKVVDFKSGDVVTYAMNENYRDPNKPYFKTVTFKGGGDAPSSARAVFQTGDVDYAWNLQVEASVLKPMADTSTKGQMLLAYGSSSERLVINFANPNPSLGDQRSEPTTKHPYFNGADGKIVRQALAMATDRKTVATQIYGDAGKPGCNIVTGVRRVRVQEHDHLLQYVRHRGRREASRRQRLEARHRTTFAPRVA